MEIVHTLKSLTTGMPVLLTGGVPRERAGDERLVSSHISAPHSITVTSTAFEDGQTMPTRFSADGENLAPALHWMGVPESAKSLVLIVEDPDAPTPNPFVHWLAYGISPQSTGLPEVASHDKSVAELGFTQGKNSNMKIGWTGMAPPKGDTPHRYFFQLFALDTQPGLEPGIGRSALVKAMQNHVIAQGRMIGQYQRS